MATAGASLVKIVGLCGSLRKASFNRGLLNSAIKLSQESSIQGLQIELVEIDSLPFINTDLEVAGKYPPAVEAFRQKILEADGFLFASPELYVQEKRASLSPNTIEALVCLKDWSLASARNQKAAEEEELAEELSNLKAARPDWLQEEENASELVNCEQDMG